MVGSILWAHALFLFLQRYSMVGVNDFVVVVVVNDAPPRAPATNDNVRIAALNTIERDTRGNPHRRSAIQKQAYPAATCQTVRQAFGLTGTDWRTHRPFQNGKLLGLDDAVSN